MNTYEYKEAVETAVSSRNFHEAFRLLRVMLSADAWRFRAELESAEEDYSRIIEYALTGAPDPSRETQISRLSTRIYNLLDMIVRESRIADHNSLYFSAIRSSKLNRTESLQSLFSEYLVAANNASSFTLATMNKSEAAACRRVVEDLEPRLFVALWTSTPLSFDEIAAVREAMQSELMPLHMKQLIVSALTMSLFQFFNEPILRLLLEFASEGYEPEVRIRATVGAVIVMSRWPKRSDTEAVRNILASLREQGHWSADVEHIVMQFVKTGDVEKIARTMREEIIPQMMKLRPDIEKHIKEVGLDMSDSDMNPEWEDLLEKSGLTERLRKLSDMQMEGGDLFYSAFSMLKSYPFFNNIANWFLPFNADRSDVVESLGHDGAMGLFIADSQAMCDSDKYSFVFSIDRLPEAQKQQVMNQITEASIQMAELADVDMLPERVRRSNQITRYVQDLFRFFRLFRRRSEFADPFARLLNPAMIPTLKSDFSEPEKIRLLAEFFFKHEHYDDALQLFRMLNPDLTLHQKMGHALERLGRRQEALTEYERAEMLAPQSEWTLKRLAQVSKALGNFGKALEYYRRLESQNPDSVAYALNMGHCYLQMNQIHEALHCYYKAEMLDEKSVKPLRPIAWCAFLNRDFETSQRYYNRILAEDTPTPADFLNLGHLSLALGNIRDAIGFYKQYADGDEAKLTAAITGDAHLLETAGISIDILPLILDAIRFQYDNK